MLTTLCMYDSLIEEIIGRLGSGSHDSKEGVDVGIMMNILLLNV